MKGMVIKMASCITLTENRIYVLPTFTFMVSLTPRPGNPSGRSVLRRGGGPGGLSFALEKELLKI